MARKLTHVQEVELAKLRLRAAAQRSPGAVNSPGYGAGLPAQLLSQLLAGTWSGRLAASALLGVAATLVVRSPRVRKLLLSALIRNRLLG